MSIGTLWGGRLRAPVIRVACLTPVSQWVMLALPVSCKSPHRCSKGDVDAYARRLEEAGGKLHCQPMDIPGVGRFASAQDPQGAAFLLFTGSRDAAPPRPPAGTPGTIGWNELSANDEKSVWPFYSNLFGW